MSVNPQLIAEEATVGGLMLDSSKWQDVKKIVSDDDFNNNRTKAVFKAITKQLDNKQPADVITLSDTNNLNLSYVAALVKNTPSAANVCAYAREVKKHSRKRKLLAALKKTVNSVESGSNTIEEALDFLSSVGSKIHNKKIASFELIPATALTTQPTAIKYLVKGYIPEKSIIEIFGAPGSGKSFLAMDWAFCIANGIDWHEKGTSQGTVVYIAGEGFAGMGQRLRALEVKHGMSANNLVISKQPASLTDKQNAQWVADAIHQHNPVLIIIDTLSRNFGGGDENSTRDMNTFISNLDLYIKGNAAVVLVHHSGHSEKSRARGSSVLNGAVDVEYCISKNENILTMANTKAKEFEPPKSLSFQMTPQELDWKDEDGDPIKSIVLTEADWKPSNEKSKPRLTGRNEAILAALQRAVTQHGVKPDKEITERFGGFGIGSGQRVVHVDYWRKEAYMVIDVDTNKDKKEAKRAAFNRAKDSLMKKHVQTLGGFWWLITE